MTNLDQITSAARELEPTKRNVIALVGKFYDPLGLLAPVVVLFKIFFQELSEAKLEWDEPLSGKVLERWRQLSSGLQQGQPMSVSRCYFNGIPGDAIRYCLYGFCDASLRAYAAVVYLLVEAETEHTFRFIACKTRVSPLKATTIPRLELLSAVLLARLMASVIQALECELQLSSPLCFSDSKVVLFWIKGMDKSWKPWVQNRVSEIRRLLPIDSWKHCSGRDNPADIPSRGLTPLELSVNVLWRNGPEWLKDGEDDKQDFPMPEECLTEVKIQDARSLHGLLATEETRGIAQIMKCEDFSLLSRLSSVTARVLKFCGILRHKIYPATDPST